MTFQTPGGALSTEPQELNESEAIKLTSWMTRVLYTTRNSNVEVVVVNDNHVDYFIFITLSPSLKVTITYFIIIYHDDVDIAVPSSMQNACHTWTQVLNGLALHEFSCLSG